LSYALLLYEEVICHFRASFVDPTPAHNKLIATKNNKLRFTLLCICFIHSFHFHFTFKIPTIFQLPFFHFSLLGFTLSLKKKKITQSLSNFILHKWNYLVKISTFFFIFFYIFLQYLYIFYAVCRVNQYHVMSEQLNVYN